MNAKQCDLLADYFYMIEELKVSEEQAKEWLHEQDPYLNPDKDVYLSIGEV